jgi:hypothetical protein
VKLSVSGCPFQTPAQLSSASLSLQTNVTEALEHIRCGAAERVDQATASEGNGVAAREGVGVQGP